MYKLYLIILTFGLWLNPVYSKSQKDSPKPQKTSAQKPISPQMWEVRSKTAKLYLFGSIHIGDDSLTKNLPEYVQNAFKESSHLVVEIDVTDNDPSKAKVYEKYSNLKKGQTLKSVLSKKTYDQLQQFAKSHQTPFDLFEGKKPWINAITATLIQGASIGYLPFFGVDFVLLDTAKKQGKKIIELEKAEDQLKIFDSLSKKDQDSFLFASIENPKKNKETLKSLVQNWKKGDSKSLLDLTLKGFEIENNEKFLDDILYKRNVDMSEKLQLYLKEKNTYFVVVGAAHFLGDKGINALLKKKGYTVKSLK